MTFKLRSIIHVLCLILLLTPLSLFAEWQTEDAAIMGTTIRVEVWHEDQAIRQQGIDKVLEEMEG